MIDAETLEDVLLIAHNIDKDFGDTPRGSRMDGKRVMKLKGVYERGEQWTEARKAHERTPHVGKFANLFMHSDVHAYEIVRVVSAKTLELRRMNATLDPEWKPEMIPGGFAGHCTNNATQKYIYTSDSERTPIRARLRKSGYYHSAYGVHHISEAPHEHYDYNF